MAFVDISDFIVSYPCFLWTHGEGVPVVKIDGEACIAFFTDESLLLDFLQLKTPEGETREHDAIRFGNRDSLLISLLDLVRLSHSMPA